MIGCLLSRATLLKVYPQLHFSLFRPGGIIFLSGNSVSSLFILLFFSFSSFYGGYSNFCLNTFTSAPLKFSGFNSTRYHLKVFQREAVKVSLCHLAIELHCWAMPELTCHDVFNITSKGGGCCGHSLVPLGTHFSNWH